MVAVNQLAGALMDSGKACGGGQGACRSLVLFRLQGASPADPRIKLASSLSDLAPIKQARGREAQWPSWWQNHKNQVAPPTGELGDFRPGRCHWQVASMARCWKSSQMQMGTGPALGGGLAQSAWSGRVQKAADLKARPFRSFRCASFSLRPHVLVR